MRRWNSSRSMMELRRKCSIEALMKDLATIPYHVVCDYEPHVAFSACQPGGLSHRIVCSFVRQANLDTHTHTVTHKCSRMSLMKGDIATAEATADVEANSSPSDSGHGTKRLNSAHSGMESSVLRFKDVNFIVGAKDKKRNILTDVSDTVKFGRVLASEFWFHEKQRREGSNVHPFVPAEMCI